MALPILFSSVALALLAISTSTTGLSIGSPKSLLPATTAILTAGSVLRPVFVTGYTFLSVAEPPSKVCRDESPLSAVKKASYIPSTCVDYQLLSKIPAHRHLHKKYARRLCSGYTMGAATMPKVLEVLWKKVMTD
jgi:hypothetical protein